MMASRNPQIQHEDGITISIDTSPLLHMAASPKGEHGEADRVTLVGCYFNMVTALVGAGFLALPYGVMKTGLILGLALLVVVGGVSVYTIYLLTRIKKALPEAKLDEYSDLGALAFGKAGYVLTTVMLCLSQLGFCCAYTIFIADNLHSLVPSVSKPKWALIVSPLFVFLSCLRSLKILQPTSIVSVLSVFFAMGVVYWYGFSHVTIDALNTYTFADPSGLSDTYGLVAFSYCIHTLVYPMRKTLSRPEAFENVATAAIGTCGVLYVLFGGLGYLFFKDACDAVITLNLPRGVVVDLVKGFLCVVLVCAFPIQLFTVTQTLESNLFNEHTSMKWLKVNVFRTMIVYCIIGVAMAIPLFGLFSSLVGCFSVAAIVFCLPFLFALKLIGNKIHPVEKALIAVLFLVFVAASVYSSIQDIRAIADALAHPDNTVSSTATPTHTTIFRALAGSY